ncbi:MAG: protein-ADP-ribose hydrolase [Oscillospiraceae bacterium]|nr:protein-ADP-ribose hydrolase [Oscillospiraceae bacterium]
MTHQEKRIYLINKLLSEDKSYSGYSSPRDEDGQRDFLRALMNVRPAVPIEEGFLRIQDEYLSEEYGGEAVDAMSFPPCPSHKSISLWQGDITRLRIDGIVNAANSGLCGCFRPLHNCIDNIIHTKAGVQLRLKCNELMSAQGYEEPTGRAKLTPAYNLPSKYVLHTVGPIVQGPLTEEHEELLASCYLSCLKLAEENGLKGLAFCCISTGVFMFPAHRAAEIATATVKSWLSETGNAMKIVFNVFKDEDLAIYTKLLG